VGVCVCVCVCVCGVANGASIDAVDAMHPWAN